MEPPQAQQADLPRDAITDFAARLVAAASPSGHEGIVAELICSELRELGLEVDVDRHGNVTGTLDAGPGSCVLLDSHMDTVGVGDPTAWSYRPEGEIADGRLYGRGAMDMKGQLAASVYGVAALRERLWTGRVVVCASVGEELVEGPMLAAVANEVRPDYVVICEATSGKIARGQRGRAEIVIDVRGKSTHSSRPDLGVNADEVMADLVVACRSPDLPTHDLLGDALLVLTDVMSHPYPALSVVPERCLATYDRRTLPGETSDAIIEQVRQVVQPVLDRYGAVGDVRIAVDQITTYTGELLEAPNFASAWITPSNAPIVVAARDALHAAGLPADEGHYAFCTNGSGSAGTLGIPTIGYGPGDESMAHRVDEHIDVAALYSGAVGYSVIAQALAQLDPAS